MSVERVRDEGEAYGSAELMGTVVNDTICLSEIDLHDKLDNAMDMHKLGQDETLAFETEEDDFL